MKVTVLMENTRGERECLTEHGLSFYIETAKHKLLADTGAGNRFLQNAGRLGVDVRQVDTVVISHGHYDHAGGLPGFAGINPEAEILMRGSAGGEFYHQNAEFEKYIGIAPEIMELPGIRLIEGDQRIDEELFVFGNVTGRRLWPSGNRELKVKKDGVFFQDDFQHEQYLVIEENGEKKPVLFSGCAHNGILNILDRFREIYGTDPGAVFSGFHMRKKSDYTREDIETIEKIGRELSNTKTRFFTGHCTGEIPFQVLKECMGEQLVYIHSGDEVIL